MPWEGTPQANMDAIWGECKAYWKTNPTKDKFNNMKISMWTSEADPHNTMPKLKGRAAECKSLVPALLAVWKVHMTPGLVQHIAIRSALESSALMDEVLDAFPDTDLLAEKELADFQQATWNYARCQNAVASYYNVQEQLKIFDITIKTHWTLHCGLQAGYLNPRKSWNFAGEDFMHHCRILHKSTCVGNTPLQSINRFGQKYCHAISIVFQMLEDGTYM